MQRNLEEIIKKFDTIPILFAGAGITRRYYDLPSWRGLLEIFARKVKDDDFTFSSYENAAKNISNIDKEIYPIIAELIERDYNELWFKNEIIRNNDAEILNKIKDKGLSPFKAEMAIYIRENSKMSDNYKVEIEKLKEISKNSIAGVITTNYDNFFENLFEDYKCFVGQEELIFSTIHGIGEIYKIHGSIDKPSTIIINNKDYDRFNKNSGYLAAKLMTIFMEYPIIFIGYSISDTNIQKILESIMNCLDSERVKELKNRFMFIEYAPTIKNIEISDHTIKVEEKYLTMMKIRLNNFEILYDALLKKKNKIPVKFLRRLKNDLYDFVMNNKNNGTIKVSNLDDVRIKDEELVMSIGKMSDFITSKGLVGITANELYRDIIMADLECDIDDILTYAMPSILKSNSNKFPLNKYLSIAKNNYPDLKQNCDLNTFDNLISNTLRNNKNCLGTYKDVLEIWNGEKSNLERATRLIACLEENEINVIDLEMILKEIFSKDKNILNNNKNNAIKTNIRRLIKIYDYLKYKKPKLLD